MQGLLSFQRGDFEQAASYWQEAVRLYDQTKQPGKKIDALIQLAGAYQSLGQPPQSEQALRQALDLSEKIHDQAQIAAIMGSLGNTYFMMGEVGKAKQYFELGNAKAREINRHDILAHTLNNLGNMLTWQAEYREALNAYDESFRLAKETGDQVLAAKILVNAAKTATHWRNLPEAETYLHSALRSLRELDDTHAKANGLIALGHVARIIQSELSSDNKWRLLAYQIFNEAANIAEKRNDWVTLSYALGYLGKLYEDERRIEDALNLTRRAVFLAQQINSPEILYQWHWQIGRLLRSSGDINGAISAYRQAITNFQSVRQEVSIAYRNYQDSFRKGPGQIYLELADLLLKQTDDLTQQIAFQDLLRQVQQTVEQLRTAELRNYFQDECTIPDQGKVLQPEQLGRISPNTAIVYPIIFPERLELLLVRPDGVIKRFTVDVHEQRLENEITSLRNKLQNTRGGFEPHAQKLYEWLIKPIEIDLMAQKINTLLFIPDGTLRTISLSALQDNDKNFLINKYAVAVTPGLTFTDLQAHSLKNAHLLIAGLTESKVDGFPALQEVSKELEIIQKMYGGERLEGKNFSVSYLKEKLVELPYKVVHMATHGKFESNVQESFIVTYDGKLTMNKLEELIGLSRFREQPVELLTLSACDTAIGDDRAALGLAGVAVKAGARSALATLWSIGDKPTALLIPEFYRQLKNRSLTKAEALRRAQLMMLSDNRYQHPGFWSPFLMIGNWL